MRLFRRQKNHIFVILAAAVLVSACAGRNVLVTAGADRTKAGGTDSPQETAEKVMRSIQELDLETFNAYTDNYEGIGWTFTGFPVVKEYKVFQDLLQPRIFDSKRYEEKHRFAKKAVEGLTWEIRKAEEKDGGREAAVELTLTNKDLAGAMERYTMWVIEDAVNDAGSGAVSLIKNISLAINECDDDLIRFIDETKEMRSEDVTVTAYQEDGRWKLHLTDEFINAFMGDIESEENIGPIGQTGFEG